MKRVLKIIGVLCLAVAAFHGLITINLPFDFGWAGLFFFFLPDVL